MTDDDLFAEIGNKEMSKRVEEGKKRPELSAEGPLLPPPYAPTLESMTTAKPAKSMTTEQAIRRLAEIASQAGVLPKPSEAQAPQTYLVIRRIKAIAWLLGASNRQLADWYKVSVPSIKQAIAKELDMHSAKRHLTPTHSNQMSLEELTWYMNKMNTEPHLVTSMSIEECAAWLRINRVKDE